MKFGAIFMDLSKAFDTLNHRLLLVKLKAHGLPKTNRKLSYRSFQRTKVSNSYSSWSEIIAGAPKDSF